MNKVSFTQKDMITFQKNLRKLNHTITVAESCTGGLIASKITSISGSSDIFKGSIVTYANIVKEIELGVKKDTMIQYGVVSKEVVKQMLQGVIHKFGSNYAIAVSGIAGPTGATQTKSVGTVVIGICDNMGFYDINEYHFDGSRIDVQKQATNTSLKKISKFVQNCLDKL
ncbi:CinA family protein [Arcobacter sp. FWKO B]|uniref:CinA family protein n=1 Tax=Arcobacter sp. FWKO B TaxID=2593672 RepID=UPI0018A51558|nr:CinA family protein [Arcobacter sp. FWKO B]QOG12954.1 CinA family protein [Arcobacter sp. FWKO B]